MPSLSRSLSSRAKVTPLIAEPGEFVLEVVPSPCWPSLFPPQQCTEPSLMTAQVWWSPATIPTTLESESTCTGICELELSPLPNCPKILLPQHIAVPLSKMAQVCRSPAVRAVTPMSIVIDVGEDWLVSVPSPNWPRSFQPQHAIVSSESTAQVCCSPVVTATGISPLRLTVTGEFALVLVPSPSWPSLLCPQHFRDWSSRSAQVCDSPNEIATALRPWPKSTLDGAFRCVFVPSPICPWML
ncbi:MAG: Uncharacterised protein [Marine Group II euryarchaeote MED-G33]|nr:MAG: Uncharacterised protein [Marine Group II euryarchaeote MED-G33]